jgi:beta-lactamase regulating signal transducer with metallopeptidase domain
MNLLSQLISENLINAIGWTILHSIWQGAAIALGFALLMFFLRRYGSRTRYLVGAMALLLVLGVSLTTFFNIYEPGTNAHMVAAPAGSLTPALTGTAQSENLPQLGIFSTFAGYFNRHLPLIVTLWFLGILILVLKLAGGFLYNQRMKSCHTRPLNKSWQNHLQKLCRQVGINKTVDLLESALVKVPMTIGHMKPVILLPVGMITGLPRDQVEALLAHELAHIFRKDYLVNIMQNVIDILYFYHPGVRWISSYVRAERENCCDDIAVSLSGDSIGFARALTSIDPNGVKNANPALAAANKSTNLFDRITRLFRSHKKNSEFVEGFVGACILVLFVLTLAVSANAAAGLNRDTGKTAVKQEETDRQVEREKRELRIIERKKLAKLKTELKKKTEELKIIDQEKLKKMEKEFEKRAQEFEVVAKELQERGLEFEKQRKEFEKQEQEMRKQEMELRKHDKEFEKQEKELREHEKELRKQEKELREQETFLRDLKKDLLKDKLIDNVEDLEFELTQKGLWINSKKLSQKVFAKYKEKFEAHSGKKLKDMERFQITNKK